MDDQVKYRVSKPAKVLIYSIAAFFDVLQFVLGLFVIGGIINPLITIFAYLSFFTYFKLKGVNFTTSRKKSGRIALTLLIEIIPYIDMLPGWTINCFFTIQEIMQEDREKHKEKNSAEAIAEQEYDEGKYAGQQNAEVLEVGSGQGTNQKPMPSRTPNRLNDIRYSNEISGDQEEQMAA